MTPPAPAASIDGPARHPWFTNWARRCFWIYAAILFTGTHWPNLKFEGPIERTDLVLHLGAFGCWAGLASLCAWFGPTSSWRNVWRTWLIGVAYSGLDEGLQAIPFIHRTCAWDDFSADVTGVTLGAGAAWFLARFVLSRKHS